jgi:UDP-GlcNAc:undecaprenyl-phosphate GlcNAc-1-phosphate transferase
MITLPHPVVYTAAFVVSFLGTLALTPLAARIAARVGLVDQPREGRFHGAPTPVLGGVAVVGGLLLVAALAAGASGKLLVVLLGAVVLGGVGLVDDVRGLGPWVRLAAEGGGALALWTVYIRAGIFNVQALDLALTVVWVIAIVNAVNMVDNMDGLAGGVTLVSALGIAVVAGLQGQYHVAPFALAVAGASAGFLVFNFPPARIFLGDAGSMALGFLLAALGLQLNLKTPSTLARVVILLLLVAVPLFDLLVVVIARSLRRYPPWLGATDHTSHRLAHRGVSHRGVAVAFMAAQLGCSSIAVVVYLHPSAALPVAIASGVVALIGLVIVLRLPHPAQQPQPALSAST